LPGLDHTKTLKKIFLQEETTPDIIAHNHRGPQQSDGRETCGATALILESVKRPGVKRCLAADYKESGIKRLAQTLTLCDAGMSSPRYCAVQRALGLGREKSHFQSSKKGGTIAHPTRIAACRDFSGKIHKRYKTQGSAIKVKRGGDSLGRAFQGRGGEKK